MQGSDSTVSLLVVEDEAIIRLLLVEDLRHRGFEVQEAASADEAVEILGKSVPDLLITDIRMPGTLDGLGLVRWVQSNLRTLPIIVTSGQVTGSEWEQGEARIELVRKPYLPSQLVGLIHGMLGKE
jgi:CheY-like chemotaxis protein